MTSRTSRRIARARAGGRQTAASYEQHGLIDDTPNPRHKPRPINDPKPNQPKPRGGNSMGGFGQGGPMTRRVKRAFRNNSI